MNTRCSTGALIMDDVPQLLLELACNAKQHPPGSHNRRIALNKLINQIFKLNPNLLGYPQIGKYPPNLYEDFRKEALQKTCLYICQQIDHYNPEHPFMAWFNFTLKNRFKEVVSEWNNQKERNKISSIFSLQELREKSLVEDSDSDIKMLQQFLEDDPENKLKSEHIKGHPEATFQVLAIAKFVEDKTWKQISQQFGIGIPALSTFVTRKLHKFKSYFQKYLQE
jgi:DNA-directed RNA polymerase specialized sigma24 family protein